MKFRTQLKLELLENRAMLTTIFVESGAVGGDGSPGAPFGTIQDAVDEAAALPGDDTVAIAAGVYEENIEIEEDDALILRGNGDVTIKHPEVDLDAGEEPEDIIEAEGDITFQNLAVEGLFLEPVPGISGRGIDAKDGSFLFLNVDISGTDGDALRVRDFNDLTIRNSSFSSIDSDGMDIEDGGTVRISNTDAHNNEDEGLEVDDVESIFVNGGAFTGNGDDGIDIDNSKHIRVVGVLSTGNEGNGLQVEAGDDDDPDLDVILSVTVIGSRLLDNGENGIQIVEGTFEDELTGDETVDGEIHEVTLIGNTSNDNVEDGYDIDISGVLNANGNKAKGNGGDELP